MFQKLSNGEWRININEGQLPGLHISRDMFRVAIRGFRYRYVLLWCRGMGWRIERDALAPKWFDEYWDQITGHISEIEQRLRKLEEGATAS